MSKFAPGELAGPRPPFPASYVFPTRAASTDEDASGGVTAVIEWQHRSRLLRIVGSPFARRIKRRDGGWARPFTTSCPSRETRMARTPRLRRSRRPARQQVALPSHLPSVARTLSPDRSCSGTVPIGRQRTGALLNSAPKLRLPTSRSPEPRRSRCAPRAPAVARVRGRALRSTIRNRRSPA